MTEAVLTHKRPEYETKAKFKEIDRKKLLFDIHKAPLKNTSETLEKVIEVFST